MAKKLNFKKNAICSAVGIVLALAAIIMFFLDFVVVKGNLLGTTEIFNGFKVAFGYKEYKDVLGSQVLVAEYKAAALPLIGFILICVSAVAGLLTLIPALGKFRKIISFAATLLLIVAAIFVFCAVASWTKAQGYEATELITYNLGAGAIVAGILSIVGGLGFLGSAILK